MPNINLVTEEYSRKKNGSLGTGLIFAIVVLVLLVATYGALIFLNRNLTSKIKITQDEYKSEYDNFLAGKGNEIFDFKNRSDVARKMLAEDQSMAGILVQIEASILPSVHLEALKYDKTGRKVTLSCIGDNFETLAKQVLSFKQNNYFSAVIPGQGKLDPENVNKIIFDINLIIK